TGRRWRVPWRRDSSSSTMGHRNAPSSRLPWDAGTGCSWGATGGPDRGGADEPVHDVQEAGDRSSGVPPRRARPDQHPPGGSDGGAVARPLAGAAPGGGDREVVTGPEPRIRLDPSRARGDFVRRAPKRDGSRGGPQGFSGPASG